MAEYTAPKLSQLSAHDYEKVKKSLGIYKAGPNYKTYTNADRFSGKRTFFDPVELKRFEEEVENPRKPFKKGDYDIEDEYRYMVSQGFRPESMQVAPQQPTADPVEETQTGFTPTYLDTNSNPALFINRFGGNKETMAHSGLKAVQAAEAAGLSIREIQSMAAAQGVQFGPRARDYIKEQLGPDPQDMFASQIASMQDMFQQSMMQQQQQYMQMQQAQDERMAALQQQMQQAMVAQQQRPEVAGVKMAEGAAGTPMQIARRGVTGAFGRRGMRISSLNV